MNDTVEEFWKMVYEKEITVIVMLSEFHEDGMVRMIRDEFSQPQCCVQKSPNERHLHTYCLCRKCAINTGPAVMPTALMGELLDSTLSTPWKQSARTGLWSGNWESQDQM